MHSTPEQKLHGSELSGFSVCILWSGYPPSLPSRSPWGKAFFGLFLKHTSQCGRNKGRLLLFSGRAPMRKGSIELPFTPLPYANDAMADFMRTLADNKSLFNSHLRRQQSPWHDSGRSVRSSGFARVLRFNYTQLLTLADWLSLNHGRRF